MHLLEKPDHHTTSTVTVIILSSYIVFLCCQVMTSQTDKYWRVSLVKTSTSHASLMKEEAGYHTHLGETSFFGRIFGLGKSEQEKQQQQKPTHLVAICTVHGVSIS